MDVQSGESPVAQAIAQALVEGFNKHYRIFRETSRRAKELYEAAQTDGANKWRIVRHIDLPGLMPTAIMMLILEIGKVMNIGFQKAYLMQNGLNISVSEIISTYVYKVGLIDAQFSYSTAINLFNNIINIILLVTVNKIVQKTSENSLW